jgi:hypothetical protein
MFWLFLHHLPFPIFCKLDRRHTGRLRKRDNFLTGEGWGEWGEGGAKSCDSEKAWSFINHSILSGSGSLVYIMLTID